MKKNLNQVDTIIYQSKSGALELKTDKDNETVWLTQEQMASLFGVQKAAISKHLKNIFDSKELYKKATVSILETVVKNNKVYKINHFNLDALRFYQKRGFHICGIHLDSVKLSRKIKPTIGMTGDHGIPVRDEIDLEFLF